MRVAVILYVLAHSFPVDDVTLLKDLPVECRLAIYECDEDENGYGDEMGQELPEVNALHAALVYSGQIKS